MVSRRIDLHFAPAADDDHAPTVRQRCEVLAEVHIGQQLDDHIHTAARRLLDDGGEIVRSMMVEDRVRTLLMNQQTALLGAGRAEDRQPVSARDLHHAAMPTTPPLAPWTRTSFAR